MYNEKKNTAAAWWIVTIKDVYDHVSNPHKATDNITILYLLIFIFSYGRLLTERQQAWPKFIVLAVLSRKQLWSVTELFPNICTSPQHPLHKLATMQSALPDIRCSIAPPLNCTHHANARLAKPFKASRLLYVPTV